ncbi:hypothetical protein QFC20_005078 [Naganishia adeliensis]|uniref:Uncharacterized protein n=1 Tax=Naganishia adeliensis TaxID=92952 RepID=A0ACC2VRK8_9TREE|nr:hypothetical protein QFC20_005078 [Naganishia adeliensis]
MSPMSFPTIIRNARDDESETLGHLHAAAFATDPMIQLMCSQVDLDVLLQWRSSEASVKTGNDTVDDIERINIKQIIGFISYTKYSRADPPLPKIAEQYPKGFNVKEFDKQGIPKLSWLRGLTEKYDESLYIREFVIAPSYQSQGFGKALMLHIINHAKEQGLTLALTASSGKPPFYAKFGFEEVVPPVMLVNGTVESINMMFLELFKPSAENE